MPLSIFISPKLATYLNLAIDAGGHGETIKECAELLIWQAIRKLVADGVIDKIEIKP